jgi:hypothetical protein
MIVQLNHSLLFYFCTGMAKTNGKGQVELWVWKGGKWRDEVTSVEADRAKGLVRFIDIALFYGNIIDYVRVVMCIVAAFTISWKWPVTSALLIFVSVCCFPVNLSLLILCHIFL